MSDDAPTPVLDLGARLWIAMITTDMAADGHIRCVAVCAAPHLIAILPQIMAGLAGNQLVTLLPCSRDAAIALYHTDYSQIDGDDMEQLIDGAMHEFPLDITPTTTH